MYCSKCGSKNAEDAVFCENCGAVLEAEQPQYQAQPYQVQPQQGPVMYAQPQNAVRPRSRGIPVYLRVLMIINGVSALLLCLMQFLPKDTVRKQSSTFDEMGRMFRNNNKMSTIFAVLVILSLITLIGGAVTSFIGFKFSAAFILGGAQYFVMYTYAWIITVIGYRGYTPVTYMMAVFGVSCVVLSAIILAKHRKNT